MTHVDIREVSLRDGLQSEKPIPLSVKLELLAAVVATAWDSPFDGPTPPQRVLDIAAAAHEHGANRFSIADTIGTTTPKRVSSLISQLRPVIGQMPLGGHFHNTRGAGLASAYAAVA